MQMFLELILRWGVQKEKFSIFSNQYSFNSQYMKLLFLNSSSYLSCPMTLPQNTVLSSSLGRETFSNVREYNFSFENTRQIVF